MSSNDRKSSNCVETDAWGRGWAGRNQPGLKTGSAGTSGRGWLCFLIWLLPFLLTLTSVSKIHLGLCMIRAHCRGSVLVLILAPKSIESLLLLHWGPDQLGKIRKTDSKESLLIPLGSPMWMYRWLVMTSGRVFNF